jgi:hypothetical protein
MTINLASRYIKDAAHCDAQINTDRIDAGGVDIQRPPDYENAFRRRRAHGELGYVKTVGEAKV